PQLDILPSFFPKRTEEDGAIFWDKDTTEIYNLIRGVTFPFPGAFSFLEDEKIRIWKAQPFDTRLFNPDNLPVRRALLWLFEYPDIGLMFQVKSALKNESGYDLLISVAVPHPVHWGTALAWNEKKPIATTWVADCGDPYMGLTYETYKKPFYLKYLEKAWGHTNSHNDTFDTAVTKTRDLLEGAVKRQLVSDVPVGVFLSGGVDSTAITAFASRHVSGKLNTYSVEYDFNIDGESELGLAAITAKKYNTNHHEMKVESKNIIEDFEKMVFQYDEPFADAANLPLYLLAKKCASDITVVLQGDGVFESDDWGTIRMPSKETQEKLLKLGVNADKNYYNNNDSLESNEDMEALFEVLSKYKDKNGSKGLEVDKCPYNSNDALESNDDMTQLFETLDSVKDKNGNPAILTANNIVANPDFEKIKADNFQKYHYELFTDTLKKYPQHDKELFDADVVISLPKVKTHQKAGITAALKNLVGVNGDKDFLPHHRLGGTDMGGDCYPGKNYLRYTAELLQDTANRHLGKPAYKFWVRASAFIWRLSRPKKTDHLAAAWYGNDTTWRMVMDLNLIVNFGKRDGTIAKTPQRLLYSLCDGIVGGQGDGPLKPDPLNLGVVCFSDDSSRTDISMATLMGLDVNKIPLLQAAKTFMTDRKIKIKYNGSEVKVEDLKKNAVVAIPPPGWVNYLKVSD
ncbi:unnamed protein product, partial [Rotaria sp. Silwood1]